MAFLWLACCPPCGIFKVHPFCIACQFFSPFYVWTVVHCELHMVSRNCMPSTWGGWRQEKREFETSLGYGAKLLSPTFWNLFCVYIILFVWLIELFSHVAIVNYIALSSAVQRVKSWHFPRARAMDITVIASWFYKVVSRDPNSGPHAPSWNVTTWPVSPVQLAVWWKDKCLA